MMTETEISLPTAVLRDKVQGFAGEIYSLLLSHIRVIFFVLIIIVSIFLIIKLRTLILSVRAKKYSPESTNTWFDWKEFREWQEKQKE